MPESIDSINAQISQICELIRNLEPEFRRRSPITDRLRIRFPWGAIQRANAYRDYFPFITNRTLNTNIAYTLQLTDVFKWIINWFDIKGVAREMLIKTGVILFTCVMEAIVYDFVRNYVPEQVNKRYKKNLEKLLKFNIINRDKFDRFDRCRKMRDDIHLHRLVSPELGKYTLNHYNFALRRIIEMKDVFSDYYNNLPQ